MLNKRGFGLRASGTRSVEFGALRCHKTLQGRDVIRNVCTFTNQSTLYEAFMPAEAWVPC
jgi:hypothetical protein